MAGQQLKACNLCGCDYAYNGACPRCGGCGRAAFMEAFARPDAEVADLKRRE